MLNTALGTSYTLDSVNSVLESYVAQNYDFGTVYAYLRRYWNDDDVAAIPDWGLVPVTTHQLQHTIEYKLRTLEANDREMRRKVLVHDRITTREVDPRRVWDMYVNRVVPYWVVHERQWGRRDVWGISHAWVDEKDRVDAMTPINGYEWPVPMPKDANLDLIRIEMLNIGAEYAWLDVLCLRQEGGKNEYVRSFEWRVDVPAIGSVYYGDRAVVCYFCGLGRPLIFEEGYFESDQCWFNRAWTLQEVPYTRNGGTQMVVCGETGDEGRDEEEMRTRFNEQLTLLRQMRDDKSVFTVLSEMQKRKSATPLDKVAGVAYITDVQWLPIYDIALSEEQAWTWLVSAMYPHTRADLFFYYPEPGNGVIEHGDPLDPEYGVWEPGSSVIRWRPSWEQVMTQTLPSHGETKAIGGIEARSHYEEGWYYGPRIKVCGVCGLADQSPDGNPRHGELVVKDGTGTPHIIKVVANHQYQIRERWYTLIGNNGDTDGVFMKYWVVGHQRKRNWFEKLSVIHIEDEDERRKLQELGVAEQRSKVILL